MMELVIALWLAFPDPLETELPRFPCAVAEENWKFACRFVEHCERQSKLQPDDEVLAQTWEEAKRLERIWDALDWCARTSPEGKPFFAECSRRHYLIELRRMLGPDYDKGLMPPCVPVWRCARAD